MSIDFEFAPVDVDLLTHPKAIAAGLEAMGLWLWGLAWCRRTGSSGIVPEHVLVTAWGASRASATRLAKRLEAAGLWVRVESGWEVWNYEAKNLAAVERDRKREAEREAAKKRKAAQRARASEVPLSRDVTDDVTRDNSECHAGPSVSVSVSVSDSVTQEGMQGGTSRVTGQDTGQDTGHVTGPPPWFAGVLDTIRTTTGEVIDPGPAWLRYRGHRQTKGIGVSPTDASYWLTTVIVREQKQDRERRAERGELAQQRRDGPPPPPRDTPEQAKAFAKQLAAKVTTGLAEEAARLEARIAAGGRR